MGATTQDPPALARVVLLAAAELSPLGETFHLSDLAVAAWRKAPDRLGLRGYEAEHPDVNRVKVEVYGRLLRTGHQSRGRGLRWLEKAGPNRFRVSEDGWRALGKAV